MKGLFATDPPILAIDVANMVYRASARFGHFKTKGGRPSGHIFGMTKMLLSLHKKFKGPKFWFALEGEFAKERRRKWLPSYKGNRGDKDRTPYFEVCDLVKLLPGLTCEHPKMEADDVLAVMAQPGMHKKDTVIIVTKDMDLWKFVGQDNVKVYYKDHVVSVVEVEAAFDVSPPCVPLAKTIFGDTSDHISPSVPRANKAHIKGLIRELDLRTPAAFKDHLGELPPKTEALVEKYWGAVELTWKVVRLPTRVVPLTQTQGQSNPKALVKYLKEFQCKSLYDEVEQFWTGV